MQLGTQPLMEASGCAAAAGAAAALGGSEVDPAVKGCLPSHGAVDQQQCLRQAALSSPGLDSGSALEEEGGQVSPGRRGQAAGTARPQQPHRISSDPDHAPGVSSEPLPAEAGNRLSHSQCGQAEERVRLQRLHELIGRELFITAAMLNHSCDPNCLVVREQGHASIVTQRPIQVHRPGRISPLHCTEEKPS